MTGTAGVVNINDVLGDHVALEVECVERLLVNAYVANLQVGGQVSRFIRVSSRLVGEETA
jgi:hypothetical protein